MIPVSEAQVRAEEEEMNNKSGWLYFHERTMISTTRIAMLQSELPRDRRFVKDS